MLTVIIRGRCATADTTVHRTSSEAVALNDNYDQLFLAYSAGLQLRREDYRAERPIIPGIVMRVSREDKRDRRLSEGERRQRDALVLT